MLVSIAPGNAAESILGPYALNDQVAALRRYLGIDLPLYEQYWRWLKRALHGDLGTSLISQESVTHVIDARVPVSLSLIFLAVFVSAFVGVGLGVLSAVRGGFIGRAVDAFALVGFAVPAYWLGAELIVLFAVKMQWLPATGYVPLTQSPTGWIRSLALPVMTLALGGIAAVGKQTREAMLDELSSEHIRMAWANGIPARSIYLLHALKNASLRIITVLGIQTVHLLGGTVLVETVFALPGVGSLIVSASIGHDLPVVVGVAVYFTVFVVLVNLATDLAYEVLNPRIKVQ